MFVPKDFSEAFVPIRISSWIGGIGIIEYPLGHPRELLSILYTFFFTCAIIISIMLKSLHTENQMNLNSSLCLDAFIYGNLLCILNGIINERFNRKKLKQCFQEINNIDERLRSLGIQKNYTREFIGYLCLIAILVTIVTFFVALVILNSSAKSYEWLKISQMVINCSLIGVPLIIELQLLALISCLRGKFQQLNSLLDKLTGCDSISTQYEKIFYYRGGLMKSTNNFRLGQKTNDDVEILRSAKEIHLDLVKICRSVNEVFGIQILLSLVVASSLLIITSVDVFCGIFLPSNDVESNYLFYQDSYVFCFNSIKVIAVNHVLHMTSEKASHTKSIIFELNDPTTSSTFRDELNEFILQLKHNPLIFTAHGFFALNHSFIKNIARITTTYLVILVQMRNT